LSQDAENADICRRCLSQSEALDKRLEDLEGSIKAFLDMQCMIGEETINTFEFLIDRINQMDRRFEEKKSTQEITQRSQEVTELTGYSFHASLNREQFLDWLKYFACQKTHGRGDLWAPCYKLEIHYFNGGIAKLQANQDEQKKDWDRELTECCSPLQNVHSEHWKTLPKERLIELLTIYFQGKTQYLAGLDRVLGKLNSEQLQQRLKLNAPPLLEKQGTSYSGEALFHFALQQWPQNGQSYIFYQFAQQRVEPSPRTIKIEELLDRAKMFLSINKDNSNDAL
jgi:hypothetical protein